MSEAFIYFLRRCDNVGPIKIGCSAVPKSRLEAFQCWSPEKLCIMGTAKGGFADERRIHRQFDAHRLHGEWFEATPEVLAFVTRTITDGRLPPAPLNDRNLQIELLYRSGKTLEKIGNEFGVSRERIRQILRKCGVESFGKRFDPETACAAALRKPEVLALAKAGLSATDIAQSIGDSIQNVHRIVKKEGGSLRKGKRVRSPAVLEKARQIAAEYVGGVSAKIISEKHGIQQPEIYRYLNIMGVKSNRQNSYTDLDAGTLISAFNAGTPLARICRQHRVGQSRLRKFLQSNGADVSSQALESRRIAAVRAANARRRSA